MSNIHLLLKIFHLFNIFIKKYYVYECDTYIKYSFTFNTFLHPYTICKNIKNMLICNCKVFIL